MSRNHHNLLDSANAYSMYGNSRRSDASSISDEPFPGPREFTLPLHTQTSSDRISSSDFNESEEQYTHSRAASSTFQRSSKISSATSNSGDFGDATNLIAIAEGQRLVIAIDYGTTFTGVAIVFVPVDEKTAKLSDIKVLREWSSSYNEDKVPSAYSYTKSRANEEQWGTSFSEDAEIMVYTKLELDAQESVIGELDMILDNLDGMKDLSSEYVVRSKGEPDYTPKKPDLVVLDYMKKIFERVWKYLGQYDQALLLSLPVDIIITHPVVWSYRARNATYRAVTLAGFNGDTFPRLENIKMLAEPEAAAVYTARYLKEEEPDRTVLEKNDTFILCDAGGGTVDVVTFRVLETEPSLELEQIGEPHSRKCGSVFIDGEFKTWLRDELLGPDDYEKLEPNSKKRIKPHSTTGRKMRDVMKSFVEHKCSFTGGEDADHRFTIELPAEFKGLSIDDYVDEGLLQLDRNDMMLLFEKCVDEIVALVKRQEKEVMTKYDDQGIARIKSILMIGGFGESVFLQDVIREQMEVNNITIHRPATSWSAVLRGAALYGIDKSRLKNYVRTQRFPNYYAVARDTEESQGAGLAQYQDPITGKFMGKSRLTWIVHRGDLAFEDWNLSQETLLAFTFRENDEKNFTISIYKYLRKDNILPTRVRPNDPELENVLAIPVSFSNVKLDDLDMYMSSGAREPYYQCVVSLYLTWRNESLEATVVWNNKVIYPVTAGGMI
ncbi:hypothetical protein BKA64DRAFT_761386 [Cadophora sp. MPI-SDFR-AT-0126]|nr:hypothetical protein BKA64DRAFT_761386 [Leotiomycetes sp. MPI-SDFR-AT-0126]